MNSKFNRRDWMKTTTALGAGVVLGTAPKVSYASSLDKLNIACIGIGGRGAANLNGVRRENIVALCDCDDARAGSAYSQFKGAKKFHDWRVMFDKMEKEIDAVVVSTPDHTHFHPSYRALSAGKHLYCEKPLAHTVWEVRTLTELAKKKGLATQLGNQRHAMPNMHRVVEKIKSGAIGKVTEVHCWVGGERGMPGMPKGLEAVPPNLKWDLWLGPAKERRYSKKFAPYGWRFWWDFGTGETGNWGCHILDIPFWALDLTYPNKVSGSGPEVHYDMTPKQMTTKLEFAATDDRGAVDLHWYHSKNGPEILKKHGLSTKGNNTLFVGTDGMLLCGFDRHKLFPEEKFKTYKDPEKSIPDSPGFYNEWIAACKDGEPSTCNFDYTGPLAESVLLANVAYRAEGSFDWDAKNMKVTGNDKAQSMIKKEFRKGWEV